MGNRTITTRRNRGPSRPAADQAADPLTALIEHGARTAPGKWRAWFARLLVEARRAGDQADAVERPASRAQPAAVIKTKTGKRKARPN